MAKATKTETSKTESKAEPKTEARMAASKSADAGKAAETGKRAAKPAASFMDDNPILKNTLAQIEKEFGVGSIMPLGADAQGPREIEGISSGSLSVDLALGGRGFLSCGLPSRKDEAGVAPRLLPPLPSLRPSALPSPLPDSVLFAFAIRPFTPAAITMATISRVSRNVVGVVASPP
ncbi:MAG: hypothetical protein ACKOHG_17970 [Planctomycetia bacterium]